MPLEKLLTNDEYFSVIDKLQDRSISDSEYWKLRGILDKDKENNKIYDNALNQLCEDVFELCVAAPVAVFLGAIYYAVGDMFDKGLAAVLGGLCVYGTYRLGRRMIANYKVIETRDVSYAVIPPPIEDRYSSEDYQN
ncbi:hypothetical protein KY312_01675 [Candidatus Woesearchaeota archaeon]|nr:hypothetical protein [Candidatus Woesearchaeota archaeon]